MQIPRTVSGFFRLFSPHEWNKSKNGRHSLKAGYEYQHIEVDIQDVNPLNGLVEFTGAFSRPAGVGGSATPFNLADFMFGAPGELL